MKQMAFTFRVPVWEYLVVVATIAAPAVAVYYLLPEVWDLVKQSNIGGISSNITLNEIISLLACGIVVGVCVAAIGVPYGRLVAPWLWRLAVPGALLAAGTALHWYTKGNITVWAWPAPQYVPWYWGSFVVFLIAAGAGALGMRHLVSQYDSRNDRLDFYTRNRRIKGKGVFAYNDQVRQKMSHAELAFLSRKAMRRFFGKRKSGIVIGAAERLDEHPSDRGRGKILTVPVERGATTIASSGSGKDTGAVIPTLCAYDGPVLVADPKDETYNTVAAYRREVFGREAVVFYAKRPRETYGLDLLGELDPEDPAFDKAIERLAQTLMPYKSEGEDDYWQGQGRVLVKALLVYVRTAPEVSDRTLAGAADIIGDQDVKPLLERLRDGQTGAAALAGKLAGEVLQTAQADETLAGIMGHAAAQLGWLGRTAERAVFSGNVPAHRRVRLADLADGHVDVYVAFENTILENNPEMARLLWRAIIDHKTDRGASRGKVDQLVIFNEAGLVGRFEPLRTMVNAGGGVGLHVWTLWQSVGTIKDHWGDAASDFLNTPYLQIFGNVDNETAEVASKRSGRAPERDATPTYSTSPQDRSREQLSESSTDRDVLPVSTIAAMESDGKLAYETLVFRKGLPLRCGVPHYFARPEFDTALPPARHHMRRYGVVAAALAGVVVLASGITSLGGAYGLVSVGTYDAMPVRDVVYKGVPLPGDAPVVVHSEKKAIWVCKDGTYETLPVERVPRKPVDWKPEPAGALTTVLTGTTPPWSMPARRACPRPFWAKAVNAITSKRLWGLLPR